MSESLHSLPGKSSLAIQTICGREHLEYLSILLTKSGKEYWIGKHVSKKSRRPIACRTSLFVLAEFSFYPKRIAFIYSGIIIIMEQPNYT